MSLEDHLNHFAFNSPGKLAELSFSSIANKLGCEEGALKLIFSLLLAYPIGSIYQLCLINSSLRVKHLYFALTGFAIGIFNYGFNFLHTTATIIVLRTILVSLHGTRIAAPLSFLFCTLYLLWGYYKTQSGVYTFEWTIPQCVLTLRLIAVAFDVTDGLAISKSKKESSKDQKDQDSIKNDEALDRIPDFYELFAHSYFPASFLVGPQFGMKKYLDFVKYEKSVLHLSWKLGYSRLLLGLVYLVAFQLGSSRFSPVYLTSHEFTGLGFLHKLLVMTITTKVQLCKYLCIWLISEGSCILTGLNYDPRNGSFDSCRNVNVMEYETTITFNGLIKSFNMSTNHWAAKYIFKRLKFLKSRFVSHMCTLVYLAMWHGWRSGYYVTFTMEFLIMKMEWEVQSMMETLRATHKSLDCLLNTSFFKWTLTIFMKLYTLVVFGYCLVPFVLLTYNKWLPVLAQFYFFAHVIYIPWQFISPCIPLPKPQKQHIKSNQD